jgi:hypothetical protein
MSKKNLKRANIPNPHTCEALTVTDGTEFAGRIVAHAGAFYAFGTDDNLVGKFDTQREAMRALPAANATGKAAS